MRLRFSSSRVRILTAQEPALYASTYETIFAAVKIGKKTITTDVRFWSPGITVVEFTILNMLQLFRHLRNRCAFTFGCLQVKRAVINMFRSDLHQQALMHTRHRVKEDDGICVLIRVRPILPHSASSPRTPRQINPRHIYGSFAKGVPWICRSCRLQCSTACV